MRKKRLLYLTDLERCPNPEEDIFLIPIVEKEYNVVVSHPLNCWQHLSSVDGVIVRNAWPFDTYLEEWQRLKSHLLSSGMPTHNSLMGKGDARGKDYLITLHRAGFPVPPSVDSVDDIALLPESEWYWVKPKHTCNGEGARKLTRNELQQFRGRTDIIVQPFIAFICEPSFFFVDGVYKYSISTTNRLVEDDITTHEPTAEELVFASQFVAWNALPRGVERVDAMRLPDGKLLLGELEDWNQYLYLLDVDERARARAIEAIMSSIRTTF